MVGTVLGVTLIGLGLYLRRSCHMRLATLEIAKLECIPVFHPIDPVKPSKQQLAIDVKSVVISSVPETQEKGTESNTGDICV